MASSASPSPPPRPLALPPPHRRSHSHSSSPSLSPKHESLPPSQSNLISPPKKSPPLPWTHQETLALIQAYQEKWYSLKKGQLKAFQWEEVAVTVAARCGFDEPSKTSTQCRHKIEKLRKRYRSELQKPYANSWQYFELMDQMKRGPMPLNARPIAVVKSFPNNSNGNSSDTNDIITHGYGSLYSSSADYYNNNNNNHSRCDGGGGGSDESDEKWNNGYGVEVALKNKLKCINNIVRGDVKSGVRSAKRVATERAFSYGSNRVARVLSNRTSGKQKRYYDGDDSESDDDDDVEEEERMEVEEEEEEEGEDGGGGMELAAEVRGFVEKFMGMENKKIEMMWETRRYQMEMEKKRMEMILDAERKIIDTIDRAFGAHKKAKMAQET